MSTYRQVQTSFWQDPDVLGWTPEEKYFYLYLITNTKTRQCGIYEIALRVMVMETGYNDETIAKLVARFEAYGKIRYSQETREIAIMNWRKFHPDTSPKVKVCVQRELATVKNLDLIALVYPGGEVKPEEKKEPKAEGNQVAILDALYQPIWESFLSVSKAFSDYKKEGSTTKKLCEKIRSLSPDDPEGAAKRILHTFHALTRLNDRFWSGQPFTPSGLSPHLDRVWTEANKGARLSTLSWEIGA